MAYNSDPQQLTSSSQTYSTLSVCYVKVQFTSGTHFCEGQRLQSIYSSWVTQDTRHIRKLEHSTYMATFHYNTMPVVPGPVSSSGQHAHLASLGQDRPTTAATGSTTNVLVAVRLTPVKATSVYQLPILLVCTWYKSNLQKGPTADRSLIDETGLTVDNSMPLYHYTNIYPCQVSP